MSSLWSGQSYAPSASCHGWCLQQSVGAANGGHWCLMRDSSYNVSTWSIVNMHDLIDMYFCIHMRSYACIHMYRYVCVYIYIYGPAAQQPRIRRIPHVGGLARYLHIQGVGDTPCIQRRGVLQGRQLWPFSATTTGNFGGLWKPMFKAESYIWACLKMSIQNLSWFKHLK